MPEGSAIEEDAASVERLSPARQVPTCSLTPCTTLGCSRLRPYYCRVCVVSTRTRDGCIPLARVTNTARPEPEPDRDQVTQAVSVGLCFTMAAVLLVLALIP